MPNMLTALVSTDGEIIYFQYQISNSPALAVSCVASTFAYVGGETSNAALGSGVGSNIYVLKNRIQDGSLIWAMSLRQTSAGYSDTEFLVSL